MGFSAITARLGLDAEPFNTALANAVNSAKSGGQQIESGLQFKGAGAIKRQLGGITQELLSGGSAADILGASLLRVGNSLKVGIAGAAALGVGGVIVKSLIEAHQEAVQLRGELADLSRIPASAENRTLAGIDKQFDALSEKLSTIQKKMAATLQVNAPSFSASGNSFRHQQADNQDDVDSAKEAERARLELVGQIIKKYQQLQGIQETIASKGGDAGKIALLEKERDEAVGEMVTRMQEKKIPQGQIDNVTAVMRSGYNAESERLTEGADRKDKRAGDRLTDTDLKSQEEIASLTDRRQADLLAEQRYQADLNALGAEQVDTAEQRAVVAQRLVDLTTQHMQKQAALEKSDAEAMATAKAQADFAEKEAAGDDRAAERAKLEAEFAERIAKAKAMHPDTIPSIERERDATLGKFDRGTAAQTASDAKALGDARMKAAVELLSVSDKYRAGLKEEELLQSQINEAQQAQASAVTHPARIAAQQQEIALQGQLDAKVAERQQHEKETLASIAAQVTQTNLLAAGKKSLAQAAAIEEQFRKASENASPAEKAAAKKERDAKMRALGIDRQLMTPEERRAEAEEQRKRAQAGRIVDARNGRIAHPDAAMSDTQRAREQAARDRAEDNDGVHGRGGPHQYDPFFDTTPLAKARRALEAASGLGAGIGLQAAAGMAGGAGGGMDIGALSAAIAANAGTICTKLDSINFGMGD